MHMGRSPLSGSQAIHNDTALNGHIAKYALPKEDFYIPACPVFAMF